MKQILSILLSFLVLTGTSGITMGTHYCGGLAMKSPLMLGQGHLDCGMKMNTECPEQGKNSDENRVKMKHCCENLYLCLDSDVMVPVKSETKSNDFNVVPLANAFRASLQLFKAYIQTSYPHYSPPLLEHDEQLMYQTFLL